MYERIWTHLLFFDELFPINFEVENIHVEIIHQPVAEAQETRKLVSRESICFYGHALVCVSVTSAVCLQMLLRVRGSVGYISRGASWEGEAP